MPLYKSTKTGPRYVTIATDMETQKQYADEKQFAENAEKRTTQVTNLINAWMNLCVQNVEKNTWQEETTVKMKWNYLKFKKMRADSMLGTLRALQILAGGDESPCLFIPNRFQM